jgi:hypothetical protein
LWIFIQDWGAKFGKNTQCIKRIEIKDKLLLEGSDLHEKPFIKTW